MHTPMPVERDRFVAWATLALGLMVVVVVIGLGLAASGEPSPAFLPLLVVAAIVTVTVLVAVIAGLTKGRPWAEPAAIVLLWLVALSGIVDTVAALADRRVNIPLGTFIALAVLYLAPAPPFRLPAEPRSRRIALALVVLVVGSLVLQPAAAWAAGPATPWAASDDDLAVTVRLDCTIPGTGSASRVHGTLAWRWLATDLFLPGTRDAISVSWTGDEATSFDGWSVTPDAMDRGGGQEPDVIEALRDRPDAAVLAIDLDAYGERDGTVSFDMRATGDVALQALLDSLEVTYLHGDRWEVRAPTPACSVAG